MEATKAFVKDYATSKISTRQKLLTDLCAAATSGGMDGNLFNYDRLHGFRSLFHLECRVEA